MGSSIKSDQRGLGTVFIIILAVVVLAIVGAVGYKVTQKKDDTTTATKTSAAATKEIKSACLKTYNDKDLCKFTANFSLETEPYKMVMTATSPEGNSSSTILSDGKGNTSVVANTGGQETAYMSVDKNTYMKDPSDGKWIKYPATDTTAPKSTSPASDIKFDTKSDGTPAKDTITYKKIGKEKCGNQTCLKYQMIDSSQPGTTTYIWFYTSNYRMARYSTKDATSSTDMTITYQAVKLTAPSPTKEFNTGADAQAIKAAQDQAAAAAAANQ